MNSLLKRFLPRPPDTWGGVWMRSLLIFCLLLLLAVFCSMDLPLSTGNEFRENVVPMAMSSGLFLLLTSIARWNQNRWLAVFGLLTSLVAFALGLLPELAV